MSKDDKKPIGTRTDSKGQIELTIVESPIYEASEKLIQAKARVMTSKDNMDKTEKEWLVEMNKIRKSKINHKGDILQYVIGRTTEDHCRFCKA